MDKEITKEYTKDDLTIVWKPNKCIHSGVCVEKLPDVYKPKEKPWITPENANISDLKSQIKSCPSGALSYYMKGEGETQESNTDELYTEIKILANGPFRVMGKLKIETASGETIHKDGPMSFCRCGASENKPFCDGAHRKIAFKG
ncbi:hypothetical protein DZC72_03825 [Maribacter algicola]|uniref:Iron-binding zinc finger CDGSH type domain-containing protein n=1 Tax=Maribacter algicola TaxID=2498892 RepID=A0A3R8RPA9_9FLAO|nr:(4Fe-4S)-binding protein [Maribacter algicola]RRQ49728.1 hypothetical protein DZC72_03825 [Maribacter algicola]